MCRQLLLLLALSAAAPGCIIGTWPLPELEDETPVEGPLGDEECDELDNDGDGSVDEGCACREARGCTGVSAGMCGFGVQECAGGTWRECGDIAGPFVAARPPSVDILSVAPDRLVRGDAGGLVVEVEPVARCPGIVVPAVQVTLIATDPVMRVRAFARDDGRGIYTATLPNAFGPGVPAQQLRLDAMAVLDEEDEHAASFVLLEEP